MNTYTQYFAEVNRAKMPANAAEERNLFKRYHEQGDIKARQLLIEGGLRFVIKIARRYCRGDSESLHNLICAGNIGLINAVDRYCPWVIRCQHCNKNNYVLISINQQCQNCKKELNSSDAKRYTTRFLTYAAWWITEAIRSAIYDSSLVYIPPYKQKEQHRAKRTGKDEGITCVSYETASLTQSFIDQLIENTDLQGEAYYAKQHVQNLLYVLLRTLKDRHAYVIIAYYGLREECKTLREIAAKLDVCPERVRQIKEDALKELRLRLQQVNVANINDVYWN